MSIGAYGIISVVSNFSPHIVNAIVNHCIDNKFTKALELYNEIDDIIRLLFSETNPSPIKFLLKSIGLINCDEVRLPLVKMQSDDNKNKLIIANDKLNSYYLSKYMCSYR